MKNREEFNGSLKVTLAAKRCHFSDILVVSDLWAPLYGRNSRDRNETYYEIS